MINIPEVKLGVIAVSRNCFPKELSSRRCKALVSEIGKKGVSVFTADTIVENEIDALAALKEAADAGVNALVVYLGNFGPEGPETLIAQKFDGVTMYVAAAEETGSDLINGRGDAYCGLLNASYNLKLRGVKAYIPENPVGTAEELAAEVAVFENIARVIVGLSQFKIFSFGPRPFDFVACNAPIKPLYDIGVEIQENSELDLYAAFNAHANDSRIDGIVAEMEQELGAGNKHSGVLRRLAQYEATLLDWAEENKGASKYFAFANKCWPAFQTQFGFVPCYVNGRLAARGIPVACETDIYGALTEYIITLATLTPPALLDINNTVPKDLFEEFKGVTKDYALSDLFMGFHCGNGSSCYLKDPKMGYQLIMKRALEPDSEPDITRGTLEGDIKAGDITVFRLQTSADCKLKSYIAQGEILDMPSKSFGTIGVIAIPEMARFYRHILVGGNYPHHAGIAFKPSGKVFYEVLKLLGVTDIGYNQPKGILYPHENPFK
ncbi:L-fucose isomerase [Clostridia bacterium]|nr:L-fucose isomerase [Clostridia bacterium]